RDLHSFPTRRSSDLRAGLSRRRAPKRDPTSAPLMPSTLRILIIAGIFSLTAMSARAAAEIVIAIRYLQAEGNSHSHLYLYREDRSEEHTSELQSLAY